MSSLRASGGSKKILPLKCIYILALKTLPYATALASDEVFNATWENSAGVGYNFVLLLG
jgi:hypothetical protein